MNKMIGIDLGTTHSLCAIFENSVPKLIPNSLGEVLTPSVVGMTSEGKILVGSPARELQVSQPQSCAWCFKRLMGTDQKLSLGSHSFSAIELSSMVLKSLKSDAEVYLKEEVRDAVITVPAYFNEHQRRATKLAGELAGLEVRRIINEPTAAALVYGFHERETEKKLLIFDLGGGTFDVTLMEIFEGTLEIISTAGENFLGGENFTDQIAMWALKKHGMQLESAEFQEPLRVSMLRSLCEKAKKNLSREAKASFPFPDGQGRISSSSPLLEITREEFFSLLENLLQRLSRSLNKVLRDGKISAKEVDEIILVGGATRMPIIQKYVEDAFSKPPLIKYNPDEVVALGAALQTALIQDKKEVEDMVMTDVCPHTLGISIVKFFGKQMRDGYFLPILHRNTTIPVSCEEIVETVHPNQRELSIKVYQGESRKVEENTSLGELLVKGIPPGPAGTLVHVRFTYDINGILEVEAYIPKTGKKYQTVLTQNVKGLSPEEIKKAMDRIQSLKFYPRDDLKNQKLVFFCEKVLMEVGPYEREELEGALDRFEQAMSSGNKEVFQLSREDLLFILSRLGYSFDGGIEE